MSAMTCPGAHSLDRAERGLCPQMSCLSELRSSGAAPPPSVPQFPLPTGEWQHLCWGLESLGLWLQIPGQVTEDKHSFPDRVRLPRSLFASLQGSRSVVRLAISVLNISTGDVFKVRSWMLAEGSSEAQQAMCALCGVPLRTQWRWSRR